MLNRYMDLNKVIIEGVVGEYMGTYEDIIGDATLLNIKNYLIGELSENVDNSEIVCKSVLLETIESVVDTVVDLLDTEAKGVCTLSNTIAIELVAIDYTENTLTVRIGKDIEKLEWVEVEDVYYYGDLPIKLEDFIRV